MDKVDIDVLNSLNNEELLDLYNQVNDHIAYLNENIISDEKNEEEDNKEESTDNNG